MSEEKKAVSDSLNQKPVEPEPMDSPGAKIRINHRQHPRAKRLTGSKQKLTELGLIAHTTISKAFPLLSVDSIILRVQPMVIGNEVTLIDSARSGQ